MRSCREVPHGTIVFLRTGMDVPMQNGAITDPSRIEETRPTIDLLREKGCRIVVATHIGRPIGADESLSSKPVADYLSQFYPTRFVSAVTGDDVSRAIGEMKHTEIIVIENLRYDPREEANDEVFAQELVNESEVIVQDAYGNAHRHHASMVAALNFKPAYMGLLLEKEISMVGKLSKAQHPYVLIVGGAKADKLSTIEGLLHKVDTVLVGGVLANTFLKAAGFPIGESKFDESALAHAEKLYKSGKIILPVDAVVAQSFSKESPSEIVDVKGIQKGLILDIGPDTREQYIQAIAKAKTVVWAGPIGVFEWDAFSEGTKAVAAAVAMSGAYTLAAGGDSGAALVKLGYRDNISHVSTGGGVTLELLEGKKLPALTALEENEKKFLSPST